MGNRGKARARRLKNRVRGALSGLRESSRPGHKRASWSKNASTRREFHKALSDAKNSLDKDAYFEFERWALGLAAANGWKDLEKISKTSSLGIFPSGAVADSLVVEIEGAVSKIIENRERLELFLSEAMEAESALSGSDFVSAYNNVENIIRKYGYSFWAIEVMINVLGKNSDVKDVKDYISGISLGCSSISKFYFFYFGNRNEPSQSPSRYISNISRRMLSSKIDEGLKNYSIYRLCKDPGGNHRSYSDVLAYEKYTTVYDLFFTLIFVCRGILDKKSLFNESEVMSASLALQSVGKNINIDGSNLMAQVFSVESSGFVMDISGDVISDLLCGSENESFPDDSLRCGLRELISAKKDYYSTEEFIRLRMNYYWMPEFLLLGDVGGVSAICDYISNEERDSCEAISFSSALDGGSYIIRNEANEELKKIDLARNVDINGPDNGKEEIDFLMSQAKTRDSLECMQVVFARRLYDEMEYSRLIEFCSIWMIERPHLASHFPIIEIFQGKKWSFFRSLSGGIWLPVIFSFYLTISEDRKIRTYKRYAIEEAMKKADVKSVDELADVYVQDSVPSGAIEYFLVSVCDQSTIELLPGVDGTRSARSVRAKVLRKAASLHTENEGGYIRQAIEIEDGLKLQDGINDLDESKIYVDVGALYNAARKDLDADFSRYKSLVKTGSGETIPLSELIKSIHNPTAKQFEAPKNEADDLLLQIIESIRERVLFDPAMGLDIVIGRRIRHGTIANELRGTLEKYDLIGQKEFGSRSYSPSRYVVASSVYLDAKTKRLVYASFSRFSEGIDGLVAVLRDEYFHVFSERKQRAVFDGRMNVVLWNLARSVAQKCPSSKTFYLEMVEVIWQMLSLRAEAARPRVESEIRKTISTVFTRLLSDLRRVEAFKDTLVPAITSAFDEVQRRGAVIASWIAMPGGEIEGKAYGLEYVVDVSLAVVMGQSPSFRPNVSKNISKEVMLDIHGFSVIQDALYIAINNINEHSGKREGNNIEINVFYDPISSMINFSITNEISLSSSKLEDVERKLAEIKSDISKRQYRDRARTDRGSGLAKLAALVVQHDDAKILFDVVDRKSFRLSFDLLYVGGVGS